MITGKNIFDIGDKPNYKVMRVKLWSEENKEVILVPVKSDEIDLDKMNTNKNNNTVNRNDESEITDKNISTTIKQTNNKNSFNKTSSVSHKMKFEKYNNKSDLLKNLMDAQRAQKYGLSNIDSHSAMECIVEVCPRIKSGNLIVKIDYPVSNFIYTSIQFCMFIIT